MIDSVGVIGSGPVARALARQSMNAGYRVLISNSRGPASLVEVVNALGDGVQAVAVANAARRRSDLGNPVPQGARIDQGRAGLIGSCRGRRDQSVRPL